MQPCCRNERISLYFHYCLNSPQYNYTLSHDLFFLDGDGKANKAPYCRRDFTFPIPSREHLLTMTSPAECDREEEEGRWRATTGSACAPAGRPVIGFGFSDGFSDMRFISVIFLERCCL